MKKIAVFMQNRDFFGAQIVHIPLLKKLRQKYPQARITLFSKSPISRILIELGLADTLVIETTKLKTALHYIKQNASLSINLRKNSLFTAALISLFNLNKKIGFSNTLSNIFFTKTVRYDDTIYRARNYLNLLDEKLEYEPLAEQNDVIIIPGAGKSFKEWGIDNYVEAARFIKDAYPHIAVRFVLGKKEQGFIEQIPKEFSVLYDLEIKKLYDTLSRSSLVIANDCGPSHIAQINGTKTLILLSDEYGDAQKVAKEWVNTGEHKLCLIGEAQKSIRTISLGEVKKSVQTLLKAD